MRSRRLHAALDHLRGHNALIDDVTDWLSDVHAKLLAANDMPAPADVTALKAVICQQMVHTTPLSVEVLRIVVKLTALLVALSWPVSVYSTDGLLGIIVIILQYVDICYFSQIYDYFDF